MKTETIYITGISRCSFRVGEPAEVIGVKFVTPTKKERRLCYEVKFGDQTTDLIPVSDIPVEYKITTLEELIKEK